MILAVAVSLALAAAPHQPADVVGVYTTDQMEVAGVLQLRPDGRFSYRLDYGAVSESAEGDWRLSGQSVEISSNPVPKPPDFTLVRDDPAPAGKLYVALEDSGVSWSPLDAVVAIEGKDRPALLQAEADGEILIPKGSRATTLSMLVPVYQVAGSPVALSGDRGHRLLFRFAANDMGKAIFRAQPLLVDGSSLIMSRYDTEIIFRRAEP
jgi:hypothetical protein